MNRVNAMVSEQITKNSQEIKTLQYQLQSILQTIDYEFSFHNTPGEVKKTFASMKKVKTAANLKRSKTSNSSFCDIGNLVGISAVSNNNKLTEN